MSGRSYTTTPVAGASSIFRRLPSSISGRSQTTTLVAAMDWPSFFKFALRRQPQERMAAGTRLVCRRKNQRDSPGPSRARLAYLFAHASALRQGLCVVHLVATARAKYYLMRFGRAESRSFILVALTQGGFGMHAPRATYVPLPPPTTTTMDDRDKPLGRLNQG